jgi:hypothetical protein
VVCDDAHTYCLTTQRFDYVLLLQAVVSPEPGPVLDRAAEMTGAVYVVSAVIGPEIRRRKANYERSAVDGLLLDPVSPNLPLSGTLQQRSTNWWLPSHAAYRR